MDFDRFMFFFTLFSPVSFIILAVSKVWLRLALFLPLSAIPPTLLLYVYVSKTLHPYLGAAYLVISLILSFLFTLLGFFMMTKAEPKTKPFSISLLGTLVASIPLDITMIAFVGGAIYQLLN